MEDVTLEVERGELMAVLGPSGCGKTTLLRLIAGFEAPDGGSVEVGEETVAGPGRLVPPEQRRVGMVFQDYALFPHLSVEANVAFGLPAARARSATPSHAARWSWSGCSTRRTAIRTSCRAASGSAWRWRGRSRRSPR